jgi:hypothetical protein
MKMIAAVLATAVLALGVASCKSLPTDPTVNHAMMAQSANGSASEQPAYYDDALFTVNMKEEPDHASESLEQKNGSINEIYATKDLDEEQDFIPVIDAVPADGMNPLWEQVRIVFNPGFTPHQFTNDEQIDAAAEGPNPEITLVDTEEMYRCSVVGKKAATEE